MTLKTLADVRELVERHLPAECRERDTWRHVAKQLAAAADGGDINDVIAALGIAPRAGALLAAMTARRFPPPWSVEEQAACFVVQSY
jgi:hypothetical protein